MSNEKDGFNTLEGLTAIIALITSFVIGGIALRTNLILLIIYIAGIVVFFTIYGSKLCKRCKKRCPCNPDLKFWKKIFSKKS